MSAGKAVVPYRTPQRKHSRPAAEAICCIAGQKHHSLSVTIYDTINISPHFASLPWMPIDLRILHKLACRCYNSLVCATTPPCSTVPVYLTELKAYKPTRQLRSSTDTSILCFPSVRTRSLGQRSFSHAAPSIWNSLLCKVRPSNTLTSFKSDLFKLSY